MMQHYVGQVLFVVSVENEKVYPCQVVEEHTKKTLHGDQVTYKVMFGVDPKNVTDLDKIKDKIFLSLNDVRQYMMDNATRWVNMHIEKAGAAAQTWYKSASNTHTDVMPAVVSEVPTINTLSQENIIELPNGQVVKAKIQGL